MTTQPRHNARTARQRADRGMPAHYATVTAMQRPRSAGQRHAVTLASTSRSAARASASAMHLADHGTTTMHGTMPMQLVAESFSSSTDETLQLRGFASPHEPADKGVRQLFPADPERRAQASHGVSFLDLIA